jgi:RNA polymerase sigma factor (sigma-70 family)
MEYDSLIYSEKNLPPLLTKEEELKYGKDLKSKNKKIVARAKDKFLSSNIKLVMKIARTYNSHFSFSYEDIVSEGMLGLAKGVHKFDIDRGVKFSTFAAFWIKQGILRAFQNKARNVRLPVGLQQRLSEIRKYIEEFESKFDYKPTKKTIQRRFNVSETIAFNALNNSYNEYSVDTPLNDESGDCASKLDLMIDEKQLAPAQECEDADNTVLINSYLSKLPEREKIILIRRFGLNNYEPMTLEEVGEELSLTRERIRQLEKVALEKITQMMEKDKKTYA